jgi:NADH-quinone oxidoreductase B subunit
MATDSNLLTDTIPSGIPDGMRSAMRNAMNRMKTWARINSPWVVHFNTGSCNGCDIEILATLTPRYDIERFGVKLKGSPRHADVLLATGPVTAQARERLIRVYEQMAEPKFVVAIGSCALSGGAFRGCYNVAGGIDQVIPVNAYIPGCPPRPEAIIDGVVKLLMSLAPKKAASPERSEPEVSEVEGVVEGEVTS